MPKLSNRDAVTAIRERRPFETHTGNMHGKTHTPGRYVYTGYLPRAYAETVADADYIVFSYSTPIAWHLSDGWVVPHVSYSITTSGKHQPAAHAAARDDYSARQLRSPWQLGLSETQGKILEAIRAGYNVNRGTRRKSTLQAVVDTGEAVWSEDGEYILPAGGDPRIPGPLSTM